MTRSADPSGLLSVRQEMAVGPAVHRYTWPVTIRDLSDVKNTAMFFVPICDLQRCGENYDR